jgi:hypothetical protein
MDDGEFGQREIDLLAVPEGALYVDAQLERAIAEDRRVGSFEFSTALARP